LSQNVVHSDSDLILHNSSVLIDKEPTFLNLSGPATDRLSLLTVDIGTFVLVNILDTKRYVNWRNSLYLDFYYGSMQQLNSTIA
ncbi:hypothetical protein, partial [Enterococcus faecium]